MVRLLAFADLLKRYREIFAAAWSTRHQLQGIPRQSHELAFLPANLEIAETPVHPAPLWAMRAIGLLGILSLLIAVFGRLDIVVVTKGKLTPGGQVKLVQPAVTGVIRQILVKDGQKVTSGQPLVELDPSQAKADDGKAHAAKMAAALAVARANALLEAQTRQRPPTTEDVSEATIDDMRATRTLAESVFYEYRDKLKQLQAELTRRQAELEETRHDIDRLRATAPLARQQATDYKALVDDKYVARHDYIEREQTALEQEHGLAAKLSHSDQLMAAIAVQKAEVSGLESQFRREQLDALDKANQQLEQNRDEEIKSVTRRQLMTLNAPVDGTVQQLAIHTVGGVVTTAQTVMEIVPNDALEAQVNIENKDIGFIQSGQAAVIKIDAFPYTRFGYLDGIVSLVSNDAIQDRRQGLSFAAHIRLADAGLLVNGQQVTLTPGMTVTAEIKTGKRSVIGYFIDPLLRESGESMRER